MSGHWELIIIEQVIARVARVTRLDRVDVSRYTKLSSTLDPLPQNDIQGWYVSFGPRMAFVIFMILLVAKTTEIPGS